MGVGVGVGVLDEIKAITAPSWDWAWAWAELGKIDKIRKESVFSKLYQISVLVPNCQQINHLRKEVKIMVT